MAPTRTRKTKASPSDAASSRPRIMATKSPARTPITSPSRRGPTTTGITASQKQALIDNLQLEVTERARKLRAQYALQAQSLRTRIEMRINRIPSGLRKMKMGDLYKKYMQMEAAAKLQGASVVSQKETDHGADQEVIAPFLSQQGSLNAISQIAKAPTVSSEGISTTTQLSRGIKRNSETFESDKENPTATATMIAGPISLPNKKQRTTTKDSSRPTNQNHNPSTVLSPKSANSRTLPSYNPKGGEPLQKSQHPTRPTSPLKGQSSPAKSKAAAVATARGMNKSATTNALAKSMGPPPPPPQASKARGRKAAAPVEIRDEGSIRTVSSASNASTGTTIVKKAGGDSAKRGGIKIGKTATGGKKTAATATATAGEEKTGTKGGRRVLRKR